MIMQTRADLFGMGPAAEHMRSALPNEVSARIRKSGGRARLDGDKLKTKAQGKGR